MILLEMIKPRIGIFYSEENKDQEVKIMIQGAINYFKGAGWDFTPALYLLEEENELLEGLILELVELEKTDEGEEEVASLKADIRESRKKIEAIAQNLSLPVEAITLYCKMAQPTSAFQLTNHPVLVSMIAQGRAQGGGQDEV